jgi:CBS domain-containing protein
MSPTLKDLLPADQQPLTVHLHDTVLEAIERLRSHDYNQLPVVDLNGRCRGEVITYDTIVQSILSMDAKPSDLRVKDAIKRVDTFKEDDDLLTTLDAIQRNDFALIVDDDQKLTGIVSTADTTVYFHNYAGDLMVIQGIEESVKEAIEILYGSLEATELLDAIEEVTDRASDVRRKLPGAIKAYLAKQGLNPPDPDNKEALELAETRLNLPKAGKSFDLLSFDEFTQVLLKHAKAPTAGETNNTEFVRKMLNKVRDTRNKLAHFRGDVSVGERAHLKFAAQWLERSQPVRPPATKPLEEPSKGDDTTATTNPDSPDPIVANPPYENSGEEDSQPEGKYAALSGHLASISKRTPNVLMTFAEIEKLMGEKLPESAYDYRAWWSNDPSKPNAASWLSQGWKAQSLSLSERRLTFVRTDDRQRAYIKFFSRVNTRIERESDFPHRNISSQGQNWLPLANLQPGGIQTADIIAAFLRKNRYRVELYLDDSDPARNKERFDSLFARRLEFEQQFGDPLEWERLDNRRACRIAIYTDAGVLTDSENDAVIDWTAQKALDFYRVFGPEFAGNAGAAADPES